MMFRTGIVKQRDIQNCRVRVVFPAHDQMLSWWLPVVVPKSQNDKAYWLPDVGEQVVCLMDEHDEDGAVLGAIYSQGQQGDATPPQMTADKWHVSFSDGCTIEYDRGTHTLGIVVPASGTINLTVNGGNLNLAAPNGDITFKTNEHQDSVNGIIDAYNGHTHPDPQGGSTGIPSPQMS